MKKLYYGDNLWHLKENVEDQSVDLIYLDPPFNSQVQFNVIFDRPDGGVSEAQAGAFNDAWRWSTDESEAAYEYVMSHGGAPAEMLRGMLSILGKTDTMAYICMMTPRLMELKRVLKPTGSIYLHCDPTANAFIRIMMNAVFGVEQFRNEIIWYYYNKMHDRRKKLFPRASDNIYFYVRDINQNFTFHQLKEKREKAFKQLARKKVNGRMVNARDEDGKLIYRMKEDRTLDNVWRIPCLQPASQERLGWPTQKPLAVLQRIIAASSNEGDVVLDPFCGCGTTIEAAEQMGRNWIGIDVTHYAITVIEERLRRRCDGLVPPVEGRPEDLEAAWDLSRRDKYQFQWWANWLVGVQNYREHKRGGDGGIDGKIFFKNGPRGTGRVIVSVKGGEQLNPSMVRDLSGTVDAEQAELGLFVCIAEPTQGMRDFASKAGIIKTAHGPFPRIQIITVRELLEGKRPNLPPYYQLEDDGRPEKKRIDPPDPQMTFKFTIPGAAKEPPEQVVYPAAHFLLSRAGR
jgi:site-specific DNA-methyltransferase (adenine-specific)